jgi:carboxymethylenebutenolidase
VLSAEFNTLMARDGKQFRAYLAAPEKQPLGAVLILHDLFGVTSEIRKTAEQLAQSGFVTAAPALFDRVRRHVELQDNEQGRLEGSGYAQQISPADILKDLTATLAVVKHAGRMGVVLQGWSSQFLETICRELKPAGVVCYSNVGTAGLQTDSGGCPVLNLANDLDYSRTIEFFTRYLTAN